MSDSTFLDTVNALVSTCQASATLKTLGVLVTDGPNAVRTAATQRLFIGVAPDGTSAQGDNVETGLPGVIDADVFTIYCIAEAWVGSIPTVRAQAFAIRAVVRGLLRPSPAGITLGVPSLASAKLGAWQLDQSQPESGAFAAITFRVECESRPSTS